VHAVCPRSRSHVNRRCQLGRHGPSRTQHLLLPPLRQARRLHMKVARHTKDGNEPSAGHGHTSAERIVPTSWITPKDVSSGYSHHIRTARLCRSSRNQHADLVVKDTALSAAPSGGTSGGPGTPHPAHRCPRHLWASRPWHTKGCTARPSPKIST